MVKDYKFLPVQPLDLPEVKKFIRTIEIKRLKKLFPNKPEDEIIAGADEYSKESYFHGQKVETGAIYVKSGKPVEIEFLSWLVRNKKGNIVATIMTRYWDNNHDVLAYIDIDSSIQAEIRDALLAKILKYIASHYSNLETMFIEFEEQDIQQFQNYLKHGFREYERDSDFPDYKPRYVTMLKRVS